MIDENKIECKKCKNADFLEDDNLLCRKYRMLLCKEYSTKECEYYKPKYEDLKINTGLFEEE